MAAVSAELATTTHKTFVIYGVKIAVAPDSFVPDAQSSVSPLRQYAAHLRAARDRAGASYDIHVGSNVISRAPLDGLDRDDQASNLAIFVGVDVEYTQVERFPSAVARLQSADFFDTLTAERRIYSGLAWFDADARPA